MSGPRYSWAAILVALAVSACSSTTVAATTGDYTEGSASVKLSGDLRETLTFAELLPRSSGVQVGWHDLNFATRSGPESLSIAGAPFIGSRKTSNQLTITMRLPVGRQLITALSDSGECTVDLTASTSASVAGTFSCQYLQAGNSKNIRADGRFSAQIPSPSPSP